MNDTRSSSPTDCNTLDTPSLNEHSGSTSARGKRLLPTRRAYKLNEAAEILGVKPITVRRLIDRGLIRPCRALRHVLIPADEIERFLQN